MPTLDIEISDKIASILEPEGLAYNEDMSVPGEDVWIRWDESKEIETFVAFNFYDTDFFVEVEFSDGDKIFSSTRFGVPQDSEEWDTFENRLKTEIKAS